MVNPLTTTCQLAIEEKVDKYVREEVIHGTQITDRHILLPSDRDGYMHLYLYDLNGKLLRQIDQGNYEVSAVYGYDEKTGHVYFASHEPLPGQPASVVNATEQHVWVAYKNGKRECLTPTA
jgi:dipeptidyl-peptidase-4